MAEQIATRKQPYYVYALCHPLTRKIGYVGMTINPRQRFMSHVCARPETLAARSDLKFQVDLQHRSEGADSEYGNSRNRKERSPWRQGIGMAMVGSRSRRCH